MLELILGLLGILFTSWGAGIFYHKKKLGGLNEKLRKEKQKNLEGDVNAIRAHYHSVPLEDLLEDDEYITKSKDKP